MKIYLSLVALVLLPITANASFIPTPENCKTVTRDLVAMEQAQRTADKTNRDLVKQLSHEVKRLKTNQANCSFLVDAGKAIEHAQKVCVTQLTEAANQGYQVNPYACFGEDF